MNQQKLIENFIHLGKKLGEEDIFENDALFHQVKIHNPWFTEENVKISLASIKEMLHEESLRSWLAQYNFSSTRNTAKTIGLVLAGNIPLVGFHDFLCVLISGNRVQCKLSSKDEILFKHIINLLIGIDATFANRIDVKEDKLSCFDAIIATGSNNSARYFNYYFGKYPNIIRKNRNSLAVLTGDENEATMQALADDIFLYFGLGCRNVSKILVPEDYDFNHFFPPLEKYYQVMQHTKYANNYEYNRSIYLVNKVQHLDNGFLLVKEDIGLSSPIGVLYYQTYQDMDEVKKYIVDHHDKIQCVVSDTNMVEDKIMPGTTQFPKVWDYADNVDTLKFLLSLDYLDSAN